MPEPRHWYLFMYDITDARRLRSVHKTLTQWGQPIQYSLFRVRATNREIEKLRFELSPFVTDQDRLMVVRLCRSCSERISISGDSLTPFDLEIPACHTV